MDTVVLSHPDADHLNGLIYILENFRVRRLWSNGQSVNTSGYARMLEAVAQHDIHHPAFAALDRSVALRGVNLDLLHPQRNFLEDGTGVPGKKLNNHSLVIKVSHGAHSLLIPGDIETEAEMAMVKNCREALSATVLVAPHHGSATSSSHAFLSAVKPRYVAVSCAKPGRFAFPNPRVMNRYRAMGAEVFTTAENGAVTIRTDGKSLRINGEIPKSGST